MRFEAKACYIVTVFLGEHKQLELIFRTRYDAEEAYQYAKSQIAFGKPELVTEKYNKDWKYQENGQSVSLRRQEFGSFQYWKPVINEFFSGKDTSLDTVLGDEKGVQND